MALPHTGLALAFLLACLLPPSALARGQVLAVGASTIYPFATAAAEQLGQTTDLRTSRVAPRGSGGGIKHFRVGLGIGENDNLIVRKVADSDHAVGTFGFSYCDQNRDRLEAAEIDGITPELESIDDASYALARPLYVYVNGAHIGAVRGRGDVLKETISAHAPGPEGYLVDPGLIPLAERERERAAVVLAEYLGDYPLGQRSASH